MDQASMLYFILLLPCLLLSAFFSSSEAAFLSLRKVRIRHLVESRIAGAKRVARMVDQPEKVLPTILLGNNLVNTAFAALTTVIMISLVGEGRGIIAATVASTVILLVLGETLPKTVAIRHAEPHFFFSSRVLEWLDRLLFPLVALLQWVNRILVRRLGRDSRALFTEEEIKVAVSIGMEAGAVEEQEAQMLENVFRFGDQQLREVMTPRTEIIALEKGATLETFLGVYQEHSHTRFPIFDGTVDNVIGTLSVKDVVRAMTAGEIGPEDDVTDVLREAYFVPETKFVGQLFHELRQSGYQVVMVADEFGGLAGLVTLKQMVEEIVGRVSEEGVQESEEYQAIDANTFQADAGMRVDEANAQLALDIPEGEYETLAGFLLTRFGHIPREGEYTHHNGFQLQVVEMRGVRIEQVRLTRVARPEPEASQ